MTDLQVGGRFPLPTALVRFDIKWSTGAQTVLGERLAIAAWPLRMDRLESRQDVVFSAQPACRDGSVRMGELPTLMDVDLANVSPGVECIQFMVFIQPRPNSPRRTIDQVESLSVTIRDSDGVSLAKSDDIAQDFSSAVAGIIGELTHSSSGWRFDLKNERFDSGLEGALAQVGARL